MLFLWCPVTQVGLKMFLGVTATVTNWDAEGTTCSLVLEDNPLVDFVELPDTCQGLYYCNVLSGVIRGALEMVSSYLNGRLGLSVGKLVGLVLLFEFSLYYLFVCLFFSLCFLMRNLSLFISRCMAENGMWLTMLLVLLTKTTIINEKKIFIKLEKSLKKRQ